MQLRLTAQKLKQAFKWMQRQIDVDADYDETEDLVDEIREFFGISSNTKNAQQYVIDFDVIPRNYGEKLALALMEECDLNPNQRLRLTSYLNVSKDYMTFEDKYFSTAKEMFEHLKPLKGSRAAANVAVRLGGRLYPAHAMVEYTSYEGYSFCSLRVSFNVGQYPYVETFTTGASFFSPPVGEVTEEQKEDPIHLADFLKDRKIEPLTREVIEEATAKLEKLERLKSQTQMICTGQAIEVARSFWGTSIQDSRFGSILYPEKVIFDTDFERQESRRNAEMYYPFTPLVRVFSLRLKTYVWVDVGDLDDYYYDKSAVDRLVLPDKTRNLLTSIFSRKEELFADVIAGKHGGLVIMACGTTGVGKTLTAEILAEYTERPLYVMELGELGTNLASVEESLSNIFKRVTRWNALLLFDEADVFLHKRDDNLERSAIVGIFLRLLDYFPGIMFLTTNRSEVIDPAILSRVTIKLDYPDLDEKAREKIWKVMFKLVGQTIETTGSLAKLPINGRQIRNLMRLSVSMYGKKVTPDEVASLSEFAAK